MRVTCAESLDIKFTRIDVRGETRRGKNGGFETITQELHAEGTLVPNLIESICTRAQAICFTHNTLKYGAKLVTVIHFNGEEVLRSISEPNDYNP